MEHDSLSLMQAYLRSQAERSGINKQKLDWFFEQSAERADLMDDGVHPLLDDNREPHYSRAVWSQAFATWALLDNKNPVKFICDYYHALEKLGENSPPHVREYVKRSLAAPAHFPDNPDQMFVQARAQRIDHAASSSAYYVSQNRQVPCFYKHHHVTDNNHLRAQMVIQSYNAQHSLGFEDNGVSFGYPFHRLDSDYGNEMMAEPKFWTGKHMMNGQDTTGVASDGINQEAIEITQRTHVVDKNSARNAMIKEMRNQIEEGTAKVVGNDQKPSDSKLSAPSLSLQLFGPNEKDSPISSPSNELTPLAGDCNKDNNKMMTQSQTSLDSTPSKASEADSCYHSINSPLTDQEE